MITQKLQISLDEYTKTVERAAEILKKGGIVAIPTETVYGLAASALDSKAINNVFKAKGRPQDNPLIVHISNTEMLKQLVTDIPKQAQALAQKFWPGPLTLVLNSSKKVAKEVSAGLDTLAVRMPNHKTALDIIEKSGLPLAAPSANTSGKPSPTSPFYVENDLDGKIDAIVYDGECCVGVESTVVSFCTNPPRLLRPGAVTAEQLREIIPDIIVDKAVLQEPKIDERVESPGMKYKHYAPKTESYLVEGDSSFFAEFVNKQENAAALIFEEEKDLITIPKLVYGRSEDESTLAKEVFSCLRKVDDLEAEKVYIHAPSKNGVGLAVYNRLIRASAFRVIKL